MIESPAATATTVGRASQPARRAVRTVATVPDVAAPVRVALYLYVFSIPFEMPHRTIPVEIPTLMGFIFLASTAIQPTRCYRWIPGAVLLLAAYLTAFAAAAVLNSQGYRADVQRLFVQMSMLVVMTWVLYNLLSDLRVVRGVLLAAVLACGVRAALQVTGIAATSARVWQSGERVSALGQNANLSAIILAAGLAILLGMQASGDRRLPRFGVLTWPLAALLLVAIVQTGSRGGLVCAFAGIAALTFRGRSLPIRIRNGVVSLLALVTLGWLASRSQVLRDRFESAAAGQLAGRERIYPVALEMVRERPFAGFGPIANQFEIAKRITTERRPRRDAHNLLLELFTATGLLGAVPFLATLALCLRGAWRARRGLLGPLPVALAAAVLMGTVSGTWIASKIVWLALAVALAAGAHWSAASGWPWVGPGIARERRV